MFGTDIGIDLGTASVLVYIKGKGIILNEPSVIAVDRNTDSVVAVGEPARQMIGKAPSNIIVSRPLREGVISDYEMTERMLKFFIKKAMGGKNSFIKPRMAVCVPSAITEVEKRAVQQAAENSGARKVFIIEEPMAAAIGAGIDIGKPYGSMVIDIGGGTTDIAVISLGAPVISTSIKVAGDHFDTAISLYMRKNHSILIGDRSAEVLKKTIGTAFPREKEITSEVKGRMIIGGLPGSVEVSSTEMYEALKSAVSEIVSSVCYVLEKTPPELAADISERGIVMTGGGCLLYGLDKAIEEKTGINVVTAEDTVSCVALGTGKYIEFATSKEFRKHSAKFAL